MTPQHWSDWSRPANSDWSPQKLERDRNRPLPKIGDRVRVRYDLGRRRKDFVDRLGSDTGTVLAVQQPGRPLPVTVKSDNAGLVRRMPWEVLEVIV
jgi:hypothetical protein